MLIHVTCQTGVMVELSSVLKIVAPFGVARGGLRASVGDIIQVGESGDAKYFCSCCNREVPQSELRIVCEQCGAEVSITNGFRSNRSGGMYCEHCSQEYGGPDMERINLTKVTVIGKR